MEHKEAQGLLMGDTVFEIDFWYDRSLRLWTCLWLDKFGNQLGAAQYAPNKVDMKLLVDRMKDTEPSEYQI